MHIQTACYRYENLKDVEVFLLFICENIFRQGHRSLRRFTDDQQRIEIAPVTAQILYKLHLEKRRYKYFLRIILSHSEKK